MSSAPPEWEDVAERYARPAVQGGDPLGWFDRFYAAGAAGEITMPWGRSGPHPLLAEWLSRWNEHSGRAVVVGCGLGADAEYVAKLGYATTAFDAAPTAIEQCRLRYPNSPVDYRLANLFELPEEWRGGFDLVVEIVTVQALPTQLHAAAIDAVRALLAPGGRLIVIGWRPDPADPTDPPPWPLTRAEIESFAAGDVSAVAIEALSGTDAPTRRWRAEFVRAG